MNLVPIGQFSKMTLLSVNALRLYDENGLMPPAYVDPSSGYRYYDLGQAGRAEMVRALRSVDMPLDEIGVGSALDDQQVEIFDRELEQLLAAEFSTDFTVPHRVFATSGTKD